MPGGVVDGQAVNASVTNAAFLEKNAPDSTQFPIGLLNPAASALGTITDTQFTVNVLLAGVGGNQSTPATSYPGAPASTLTSGYTHQQALIEISQWFDNVSGHTHNGLQGQGGHVAAVTGISASGYATIQNGVVLVGSGFVQLSQTGQDITIIGVPPGLPDVLAVNNSATAGINFNGGAFVGLSYGDFDLTTTPPAPPSGHVEIYAKSDAHFYRQTAASAETRVDATLAVSGQSAIYGDALLVPGTNVTLSQSGQQITISAAASGGTALAHSTKTSNYTIQNSDDIIYAQGAITLTLQASSAATIKPYYLKNIAASSVSVATNGTDTINGATAFPLTNIYDSIIAIPDGVSVWNVF